ncbi:MAG: 50S ribosomal protein L17 [Candidatus Omnitrophica bacterium]|nr:50S ribosomal protein L17 [Candidatus Omnitrophota bacterium]
MRHRVAKFQLNRFSSWRKATLKSLARSLVLNQRIITTQTKAKAVRPLVERIISLSKKNTLAAKRQAYKILCDHKIVSLLFNEIGPRFTNRLGGYTRMIRLDSRRGDNARLVILELTEIKKEEKKKPREVREAKPEETKKPEAKGIPPETPKPKIETTVKEEKPPLIKKPSKRFLGGLRQIFKKERDSL